MLTRPFTSSLLSSVQHQTSAVAAAPPGSHWAAATQKPLGLQWADCKDDYSGWVKHFPSLKQIWSCIWNDLRLMNLPSQQWFHMWLHFQEFSHDSTIFFILVHNTVTEFTHEFMIMNSYMISLLWIHRHEFGDELWILTYDFTIFFMIMNSYLNSYYEYATFHDLWIRIWIHSYEEYREIIPEIMCTKVPDGYWPASV